MTTEQSYRSLAIETCVQYVLDSIDPEIKPLKKNMRLFYDQIQIDVHRTYYNAVQLLEAMALEEKIKRSDV